jgi:hypothetical protein
MEKFPTTNAMKRKLREKPLVCVCVLFIYREREMILYDILSWLICGTPTSSKSHRTQEKSPQERPWPFPPPSPLRDAIVRFLHQNIEACFDVF